MRYKVVFGPRVAVRTSPSTSAKAIGAKPKGDIVEGEFYQNVSSGQPWLWLNKDGEGGYMLIDGTSVGLGTLLEPIEEPRKSPPPKPPAAAAATPSPPKPPPLPTTPGRLYQVVHSPHIAVRNSPSRSARAISLLQFNAVVKAWPVEQESEKGWVRLEDDRSGSAAYALSDGRAIGFGTLLQPLLLSSNSADDDIEKLLDAPSLQLASALALRVTLPTAQLQKIDSSGSSGSVIELRVVRAPQQASPPIDLESSSAAPSAAAANGNSSSSSSAPFGVPSVLDPTSRVLRMPISPTSLGKEIRVPALLAEECVCLCVCVCNNPSAGNGGGGDDEEEEDEFGKVEGGGEHAFADGVVLSSRWLVTRTVADPLTEFAAGKLKWMVDEGGKLNTHDLMGDERGCCEEENCTCDQYVQLVKGAHVNVNTTEVWACARHMSNTTPHNPSHPTPHNPSSQTGVGVREMRLPVPSPQTDQARQGAYSNSKGPSIASSCHRRSGRAVYRTGARASTTSTTTNAIRGGSSSTVRVAQTLRDRCARA